MRAIRCWLGHVETTETKCYDHHGRDLYSVFCLRCGALLRWWTQNPDLIPRTTWWLCSDGDMFPTEDEAQDHCDYLNEVTGSDRYRYVTYQRGTLDSQQAWDQLCQPNDAGER